MRKVITFDDNQKKDIIRRYFKDRETFRSIANDYVSICSLNYLYRQFGIWISSLEYRNFIYDILGSVRQYSVGLGNKNVSYWQTEDDILFRNASYKSLSKDEKIIYQYLLQKSLDNINQYGIASWK